MQFHSLHAVVLNRRSVKDNDRFYTLFTLERGKLDVYARGVRTFKSKRHSSLDLFSQITCQIIENHDRLTLTSVELVNPHTQSKDKLANISRLFVLGELVDALLPLDDPHPKVYELLSTALDHLHRFDTPQYLYRFKTKLLQLLGYWSTTITEDLIDDYISSLLSRPLRAANIMC